MIWQTRLQHWCNWASALDIDRDAILVRVVPIGGALDVVSFAFSAGYRGIFLRAWFDDAIGVAGSLVVFHRNAVAYEHFTRVVGRRRKAAGTCGWNILCLLSCNKNHVAACGGLSRQKIAFSGASECRQQVVYDGCFAGCVGDLFGEDKWARSSVSNAGDLAIWHRDARIGRRIGYDQKIGQGPKSAALKVCRRLFFVRV